MPIQFLDNIFERFVSPNIAKLCQDARLISSF